MSGDKQKATSRTTGEEEDNMESSPNCFRQHLTRSYAIRQVTAEDRGDPAYEVKHVICTSSPAQDIKSQEKSFLLTSLLSASSASSCSTKEITEAAKMLFMVDKAVKILERMDSDSKAKKPAGKSFFKKMKSAWKKAKKVSEIASPKLDHTVEKEEDTTETDIKDTPPTTTISCPSPNQVDEFAQPENQPLAEIPKDFQGVETSKKSTDSYDEVLRAAADTDLVDSCSQASVKTPSQTSSASSLYTTSAIFEAANTIVAQVIDEAVKTLERMDSDRRAKRPAGKTFFQKIKNMWKKRLGKKRSNKVAPVCHNFNLISTPLKDQTEQDKTSPEQQLPFGLTQLFVISKPPEERPTEADEDRVIEIYLPPGPSNEDRHSVVSQDKNEEAAEQQLVLSTSTLFHVSPIISERAPGNQDSHSLSKTSSTTSTKAESSLKADPRFIPLVLEDYDMTPDFSLSSIIPIPSDHQIFDISQSEALEDPPLAESMSRGLHEEMYPDLKSQFTQTPAWQSRSEKETEPKKTNRCFRFFRNIFSRDKKNTEKEKKEEKKSEKKLKEKQENPEKKPGMIGAEFKLKIGCCSYLCSFMCICDVPE